jgi:hypothetical protein
VVIDEADAGGGGGVCDMMWATGYGNIVGVQFGESAIEFDRYGNLAAEMWLGFLKDMMKSLDLSETIEGDNGKRVADMKLRDSSRPALQVHRQGAAEGAGVEGRDAPPEAAIARPRGRPLPCLRDPALAGRLLIATILKNGCLILLSGNQSRR